jgi:L-2-hydroxyglutarate oxidase LhgO
VRAAGGDILTSRTAKYISSSRNEMIVGTGREEFRGRFLINCGGLFSDRIAQMTAKPFARIDVQIIPFRGEYYKIAPEKNALIRGLIYPVPDPRFPFLGVHFTRSIHGYVEAGPNAVLAFAREGYRKTDFNPRDLWETLSFSGFRSVARRYWRMGLEEQYRSLSKRAFTSALQQLVPDIDIDDLQRGGSGVRAQAVAADGALLDDFVIRQTGSAIHVLNAPSPGATASLAIGESIVATAASAFRLRD